MIDIEKVRNETPACESLIHFNNAGASLSPLCVTEAVKSHIDLEQQIGGYEAAALKKDLIESFYKNTAALLNASPDEVAFIENATRAWDMIFYGIPFDKGDKVITSRSEYASNYIAMLQLAKRYGISIEVLPDDGNGQLDCNALEKAIDHRTKLVAITHVPTNNGLVNPAERVGDITKDKGVLFLLDACQSLGQIEVDVEKIGCDFVSGTGRKFLRGPRGTGLLYVRRSSLEKLTPPFLDLHSASWTAIDSYHMRQDAKRFETWEGHVAGKIGLSKAISYCLDIGIKNIERRVTQLAEKLRQTLEEIEGVKIYDRGGRRSGIVTFSGRFDVERLKDKLQGRCINTSISTLEYGRLDMESLNVKRLLRASLHYYNTEDEISRFVENVGAFV